MSAASTNTRPYRRNAASANGAAAPARQSSPLSPTGQARNYPTRANAPSTRPVAGKSPAGSTKASAGRRNADKPQPKILFQQYFKSVGPRTYAAQVKQASNGNHFLVLTEGKRDPKTGEVKKISLYVYSEDFVEYFKLMKAAAEFVKANPVSDDVRRRQAAYWNRQKGQPSRNPSA